MTGRRAVEEGRPGLRLGGVAECRIPVRAERPGLVGWTSGHLQRHFLQWTADHYTLLASAFFFYFSFFLYTLFPYCAHCLQVNTQNIS